MTSRLKRARHQVKPRSRTLKRDTLKRLELAIVRAAMYQYRQLCKLYGSEEGYLLRVRHATLIRGAKTLIRACAAHAAAKAKRGKGK